MITPSFILQQNDDFVIITITAPFTNIKDSEVFYGQYDFLFVSKPYFLRLFLPKKVIENETAQFNYDSTKGIFVFHVPKKYKGEYFAKLEMLNELLKPSNTPKMSLIEITSTYNDSTFKEDQTFVRDNDDKYYDEHFLKKENANAEVSNLQFIFNFGCGFAWLQDNIFLKFKALDIIDLAKPEDLYVNDRWKSCKDFDTNKFDFDYYLIDTFEPNKYIFEECMYFKVPYEKYFCLTENDKKQIEKLEMNKLKPANDFDNELCLSIAYSLIDILCSYMYDLRLTCGEHTVESSWTISKLSPSLSFLVKWPSLKNGVVGYVRRALTYPLIRNWDFAIKTLIDLNQILKHGKISVLKCLLDIHKIFKERGDYYYLFNQLFIEDYIVWVQRIDETFLNNIFENYNSVISNLNKESVDLNLSFIEMHLKLTALKFDESEKKSSILDSDDDDNILENFS